MIFFFFFAKQNLVVKFESSFQQHVLSLLMFKSFFLVVPQRFTRTLLFEVGTTLWFGNPGCGAAGLVTMWSSWSAFFFLPCVRGRIYLNSNMMHFVLD